LNTTPDSFSDGNSVYNGEKGVQAALEHARELVNSGAMIIDIGGQSTRPGADQLVTWEHEAERVIPVIKAIRSDPELKNTPLSVDTYRFEVALAALDAGADMINDVTGGFGFIISDDDATIPSQMTKLWGDRMCSVCIMHMRGDPKTMQRLTKYDNNVVSSIRVSLMKRINAAMFEGRVLRWKIFADPGIGFAKTHDQNFEIIRNLKDVVDAGFPILVGPSRKGFIGAATGDGDVKGERRLFGTGGACSAAVGAGASALRVHDMKEIRDVVRVADRCFKELPNFEGV
jgi:dihydroneopterin aldolase/2-amino-4-hydroxy-6-hydroxymethyldihydropteridine diphosphokinase/dihydropteroate synthase